MLTTVHSAGVSGITAYPLDVEVDIARSGLPKWHTVGLPESEVRESKERVVAAIRNSGYDFLQRKITINLAPADVRKEGTALDVPIAVGLLASSGLIQSENLARYLIIGELSLNGEIRPVRGALPIAILAAKKNDFALIVPSFNAEEAARVSDLPVYGMSHLTEIVEFIEKRLPKERVFVTPYDGMAPRDHAIDFDEICGQYQAKRALEVAAAGGHNLLFIGSPGSGKTMLASRLPTILPPLTLQESLQTSQIYSVVGLLQNGGGLLTDRPFRSPHHSISDAGLIGGGPHPKPGEVSLAHNGVLFLDELPEFKKHVLELLRQPLESGHVTISRAATRLTFPSSLMLIGSMNPCPCGFAGHPKLVCICAPTQIQRYRAKLSGPLLDRIDLQVEVPPVSFDEMSGEKASPENSSTMRRRVMAAREIQRNRFGNNGFGLNAKMGPRQVKKFCPLKEEGRQIFRSLMEKYHLTGRAYHRILKVARTIADLDASAAIETEHFLEAVQYRSLDRHA